MKFKLTSGKLKNQFVLSIGDEGAIFCHFDDGKLVNKLFIESPVSPDIALIEKLMSSYKKTPVYVLVDVIEQNYSQQVLPPVSSFGIRQQVQRRVKRDFQPNDFNNVLFIDRMKEGRKDWNFLFISLANSDPFAKWLEVILNQDNYFKGVYLLPLEVTKLVQDINKATLDTRKSEWELLVLHNKIGGFRIVAFKNGKLIFTRLAQNLIGDNIPDIIVGNMEQEISNTVEYLKHLAFKGEADSKITIIAGAEILQKVEVKNLKFGAADLFTPYQVAQRLELTTAVTDKDRFADILLASHFAATKTHILKFDSPYTKKLDMMYKSIRGACFGFALILLAIIGLSADEAYQINQGNQDKEDAVLRLNQAQGKLKDIQTKKAALPSNIDKILDIMNIANTFTPDKYRTLRLIIEIAPVFNDKRTVKGITYTASKVPLATQGKKAADHFQMDIEMNFVIQAHDQDLLNNIADNFLKDLQRLAPKYKIAYSSAPKIVDESKFEQVNSALVRTQDVMIPAKISITGDF